MAAMSLVVSVLLWANIYNFSKNPTKTDTISMQLTPANLDKRRFAVMEIPERVSVTLAGTKDQLAKVSSLNPSAIVDLSATASGTKSYPVLIFPSSLRELLVSSGVSAQVTIQKLQTKKVEVKVKVVGGGTSDDVDVFPNSIYATGPKEMIERVTAAQITVIRAELINQPNGMQIQPVAIDRDGKVLARVLFSTGDKNIEYSEETLAETFSLSIRLNPILAPKP
jgi:YbbR domain-containing protein